MRRPGLRVDEDLDHRRHAQQHECGRPRQQARHQQHRHRQLDRHGDVRREHRRQQRQLVLVGEERQRRRPVGELDERRVPEHRRHREPQRDREQRVRHRVEALGDAAQQRAWAGGARARERVGGGGEGGFHDGTSCSGV